MTRDEPGHVRLWSSTDDPPQDAPRWLMDEKRRVHHTLVATSPAPYPCHFGAIGERAGTNHYTYIDTRLDRAHEAATLAGAITMFLTMQKARPDDRLSLLIMVGPPESGRDLAWYRALFWRVLSDVGARDERPAPAGSPADPQDPAWNFQFAGESLFLFGTCPAYGPRRSRVLGRCLVIGLQSLSIFRELRGHTDAGRAAKRRIRQSLAGYEDVPLLTDTGDGLGSTTQKWKQYFPEIDGRPLTGKCPIRLTVKE
jgi:uncharacterized protein